MKALLFAGLWVVSTAVFSTELRIFEQHLTIHPDCTLEIKRPDGSQEKKSFSLGSGYGGCAIISLGTTNIPHLEWMPQPSANKLSRSLGTNIPQGSYVFLVESRKGLMEECIAEYGVVVARTGEVKVVPETSRRSGTCGVDRDQKVFEILYNELYNRKVR